MLHTNFWQIMLRTFWDISTSLFWRADERGSDYFPTQVCFNMNMHIIHMLLDCRLQTHSLRSFEFVQWDIMSKSRHINWGFCKKRLETATTKQTRRTLRACAKPRESAVCSVCRTQASCGKLLHRAGNWIVLLEKKQVGTLSLQPNSPLSSPFYMLLKEI